MSDLVELGLRSPGATQSSSSLDPVAARSSELTAVIEAFLNAFTASRPEADPGDIRAFADEVYTIRQDLAESRHDQEARRQVPKSVKACERLLKQSRGYHAAREAALRDMITVFRTIAQDVVGVSAKFTSELRSTSDRMRELSEIDDIRELKSKLALEATALQKAVADKQQRDQQALSELAGRVQELESQVTEAEVLASTDPLTKVANRRGFDRAFLKMIANARKTDAPMTLAMIDIDRFKAINDEHGHPIGDRVLLCTAQALSAAFRKGDLVARYGGEEFAVVLASTDLEAAERRVRGLLAEIAGRTFEFEAGDQMKSLRFTVSCGLAQLCPEDSERDLIRRADRALYDAKQQGRNTVVVRKRGIFGSLFG